jgi:molecular chaperone DnaK (HSP70)
LVDISPYSFGPSYFGILNGMPSEHCYRPIIVRNTPLPISRTESYLTMVDNQEGWQVSVYQGDDDYALNNILVGRFVVEGFSKVPAGNEILCRMDLDLDGILRVTATEKRTGLSKHITIEGATTAMSEAAVAAAQQQMQSLFGQDLEEEAEEGDWSLDAENEVDERDEMEGEEEAAESLAESAREGTKDDDRDRRVQISEARALLERSRRLLDTMNNDDREEAISLHERIENALSTSDPKRLHTAMTELADLLFYVEEK